MRGSRSTAQLSGAFWTGPLQMLQLWRFCLDTKKLTAMTSLWFTQDVNQLSFFFGRLIEPAHAQTIPSVPQVLIEQENMSAKLLHQMLIWQCHVQKTTPLLPVDSPKSHGIFPWSPRWSSAVSRPHHVLRHPQRLGAPRFSVPGGGFSFLEVRVSRYSNYSVTTQ